jgi:hypothetical protein
VERLGRRRNEIHAGKKCGESTSVQGAADLRRGRGSLLEELKPADEAVLTAGEFENRLGDHIRTVGSRPLSLERTEFFRIEVAGRAQVRKFRVGAAVRWALS